jgi:hypothetical protein
VKFFIIPKILMLNTKNGWFYNLSPHFICPYLILIVEWKKFGHFHMKISNFGGWMPFFSLSCYDQSTLGLYQH